MAKQVEVMFFPDVYGKIYFKDFIYADKKIIIVALPFYQSGKMWMMPIIGTTSVTGSKVLEIKKQERVLLSNNKIKDEFLYTLIKAATNGIRKDLDKTLNEAPEVDSPWSEVRLNNLDGCYSELRPFLEEFEKGLNTDFQECRAIQRALHHFKENEEARIEQAEEFEKELEEELKEKGFI